MEAHTPGSCVGAEGPSGPHRPAPHPPPVRPELIWHSTPTLHTRVCVVQIGWRQWWHSHSCGWLVFPRLHHSHPSHGQIWGRDAEWACSEILDSSGKVRRPFRGRLSDTKRFFLIPFFLHYTKKWQQFSWLISLSIIFTRIVLKKSQSKILCKLK